MSEVDPQQKAGWYSWYVVFVLMVAYTFSFIDRQILALLVEPIKADLGFSDTQVSLLYGFAFAVFYTGLGLPLGRLADRTHRRNLIAAGVLLWSAMTALCGMVRTFPGLFLARVGVGVGEAALSPAAYSMIGDYFPRRQLGRAFSAYGMGIYIGVGLAIIIGGQVVDAVSQAPDISIPLLGVMRPWQLTFIAVGLPGVLVVALLATVREPIRTGLKSAGERGGMPMAETMAFLRSHRAVLSGHFLGFGFASLSAYALASWLPTLFIRVHGWTASDVAWKYGPIVLVFGTLGMLLGGMVSDRLLRGGRVEAPILTAMLGMLLQIVPVAIGPVASNEALYLSLFAVSSLLASVPFGISVAALQMFSPNELRGLLGAMYLFAINIIGLAFGPTAVAVMTDYVFGTPMALGRSMSVIAACAAFLSAVTFALTLRPFRRAVALADQRRS